MKATAKLATLATLFVAFALPAAAQAQAKIASANVQRIFSDIKETKALETQLNSKGDELKKMQNDAGQRVQQLRQQRDQFKPGTDTYDRANRELSRTATELQVQIQIAQQELVREQKQKTKDIYDKIVTAVSEVAKEKGYTMVVAQVIPPEPSDDQFDRLSTQDLINLLRQQNLLYVDPSVDITSEIITRMDARYTGPAPAGNTGGAAPAPTGGAPAGQ